MRAFCPVSFDLTSFKEYNRLYGMRQGDLCLRKIADTITGCFPGALVGHLTADHFVALLPSDDLETKLEHVCNEVNHFINDDGIQLKAGVYKPSEKDTLDDLRHAFDAAKIACDGIKADGNRSVALYARSMGESLANKSYVLRHFSEALEKHYVKVYYQPVIRTLTGEVSGFEALARWEDPTLGMILPGVFVPVLEEAQLINRLDRYVLEQVVRTIRDRLDNGLPLVPISVNLSTYDFDAGSPLDAIEKTVERYGAPRSVLCCFLCFCRRDNAGNVVEKLAKVAGVLPPLWRRLRTRATPVLTHAVAYGSEVMSLDELLQLLTRRLSSAEEEAYGDRPYTEDRVLIRRDVLDSLGERVVISDPMTYELVYMNPAARKDVGIAPDASLKGLTCHKALEGFDAPCRDCPNLMLRMDRALSASHMSNKTGRNLLMHSFLTAWGQRTLKLTIALDMDKHLEALTRDHSLVYQEMRANEAISSGMREADPERGIERTISCIADNMQPERFLIFEERDDNTVSATYEWAAPGVVPLKEELQSIPRNELRGLYAKFVTEHLVMVRDTAAFREEYPGFSFRINGVRSFVSGQLLLQNQREGFTLVVNPSQESFQTSSILYSTLTDFIAVMIRNRNGLRELERQSMIDQLTGAGNRRALERRIHDWRGDGVLGVISIDLNGLKNTNDTKGHHAGDMMISESARLLRECAGEKNVFRTGGDEFVIITEDVEERDDR